MIVMMMMTVMLMSFVAQERMTMMPFKMMRPGC